MTLVGSKMTVGGARSMQIDRGARIRSFRKLRTHDPTQNTNAVTTQDSLAVDMNGKQYAQVKTKPLR